MHLVYTGETVRMASLYSVLFIYVCISLLYILIAKYDATTAYMSCENSKGTDNITSCGIFCLGPKKIT